MFNNLTTDGIEKSDDRVGGFKIYESGIYEGFIKMAYGMVSKNGAKGVRLSLDINGTEYREDVYVTNREGDNFYYDKNDKSKKLPQAGFSLIDDMCFVATGSTLAQTTLEKKVVQVYNIEKRENEPQERDVLVDLLNAPVKFAIIKKKENKQVKSGDSYVDTPDEIMRNEIVKFFNSQTNMTAVELREYMVKVENDPDTLPEGKFMDEWVKSWKDKVDTRRFKNITGSGSGRPQPGGNAQGANAGGGNSGVKSLFGNK